MAILLRGELAGAWKPFPCRLCGVTVFMEESAEAVVLSMVRGGRAKASDWFPQGCSGREFAMHRLVRVVVPVSAEQRGRAHRLSDRR